VRDCLEENGRIHYEAMAKHEIYQAGIYTCNTAADCLANIAAAGMAIYGEVGDVGAWLRFVLEKVRLMTDALGPDGASQEGICYGGFYTDFYVRTVDLVRELLGWDFFDGNEHLRNVPYFYLYSMLPREHVTPRSAHLYFGDGVRYNWHGPDYFLRKLASTYRSPHAQWAAEVQEQTGATRHAGAFLNLVWHDPSVPSTGPDDLPTLRHFADKDIVFMRSDWGGDEAVFAFKCGPHAGHHALRRYQHCIGGGHMAPDAGSFQLFAHGDWLLSNGGYSRKFTAHHNTALINGIGQTGEPGNGGDWFECTELRRERRGPSIVRADTGTQYDYVIGNVAPAYEHDAGLKQFLRHVLYVKPYCWVVLDEFEMGRPATVELFFHAFGEEFQADRAFRPAGTNAWTTGGASGALRITMLLPSEAEGFPETQPIQGIGVHRDRWISLLRLHHVSNEGATLFLTVLEAHPASESARVTPSVVRAGIDLDLILASPDGEHRFRILRRRRDVAAPAVEPLS